MKIFTSGIVLAVVGLSISGCGPSGDASTKDTAMKAADQTTEAAPTLSPEQAAAFKDSVTKKPKRGAAGDQ